MSRRITGFIRKSWGLSFVIIALGSITSIIFFTFSTSPSKPVAKVIAQAKPDRLIVSGVAMPDSLDFAGEKVPLEDFDVKESLERELLVNIYWHSQTLLMIKRSARYFGELEPILKKCNIPDDFKYLALAESGLINVTSPAGAVGFWQFVQGTAKDYGLIVNGEIDERYHLAKATEAMCGYMRKSHDVYKSWTMAAASYNMGRAGLSKQVLRQYTNNYYDILLNDETSRYVYRILAIKLILSNPKYYGFDIIKSDYYQPIPYKEMAVSKPIRDLAQFAFDNGTNYKMLKLMNPWLRDISLTNKEGRMYLIRIPEKGYRNHSSELKKEELDKIEIQSEQIVQ